LRILVTVKRIPDPDEHLKFSSRPSGAESSSRPTGAEASAGGAIDRSSVKWVANAFDEYAVETALRLAEHVGGKDRLAEVVVVSVCPAAARQHLTQFLAMGADRGVLVDADDTAMDSQTVARLIAAVFVQEQCDLLIAGKLSQDSEGNEVAQRVAGLLDMPQATFAASLRWDRADKSVTVVCEGDDGVETKRVPLPAVVSCDLRIVLPQSVKNGATAETHAYQEGPRLASLRGITMAKRKPVAVQTPASLGVQVTSRVRTVGVQAPPRRPSGQILETPEQLIEKLVREAKVL